MSLPLIKSLTEAKNNALRAQDKKVIEAFIARQKGEGVVLHTDGRSLFKEGLGSEKVAVWRGPRIAVVSSEAVRYDQTVLRYLVKHAGKSKVSFPYPKKGHDISLRFEQHSDVGPDNQIDAILYAYVPERKQPVGKLLWWTWRKQYGITKVEVDPKYRRAGIATALYKELFKREGISKKDLQTTMRTPEGQAFRSRSVV